MEQKELIAEAREALDKSFHAKAAKLANGIEDKAVKEEILTEAARLKQLRDDMEIAKAPKPKAKKAKKAKASNELILEKYDELMGILAEMDSIRRGEGKPYRVYFFHRRQIENLRRSFVKGTR